MVCTRPFIVDLWWLWVGVMRVVVFASAFHPMLFAGDFTTWGNEGKELMGSNLAQTNALT